MILTLEPGESIELSIWTVGKKEQQDHYIHKNTGKTTETWRIGFDIVCSPPRI